MNRVWASILQVRQTPAGGKFSVDNNFHKFLCAHAKRYVPAMYLILDTYGCNCKKGDTLSEWS